MKFITKKLFITVLVAFILFIPVLSLAQPGGVTGGVNSGTGPNGSGTNTGGAPVDDGSTFVKIKNPIQVTTINGFIRAILVGVVKIGIPIVALAIIYSGFLYVSARGNPESLKKAHSALLYSIIGAAILFGAWAIAQLISDTVLEIGNSV